MLRRITERPTAEEDFSDEVVEFESKAQLDESEMEEKEEEVEVAKEGGSDFTGVTVEAWTSFNRLEKLITRNI